MVKLFAHLVVFATTTVAAIWRRPLVPTLVVFLLVAKPIIDLTWRLEFASIIGQRVNLQAIAGMVPVSLAALLFVWRRRRLVHSRVVLAFALLAALAVAVTPTAVGARELLRLLSGLSIFFIAGHVLEDERQFDRFARWFVIASTVPVLLALFQALGYLPFEYWDWQGGQKVGRASGTYQHPLNLIMFLVYAIPLALYLEGKEGRMRNRIGYWVFIGLSLTAAIFTRHRAGLVVLTIEILAWFVLNRRYKVVFASLAIVGVVALAFLETALKLYGARVWIGDTSDTSFPFNLLRGRGVLWYLFLDSYARANPLQWLLGLGGSVAEGHVPGVGFVSSNEPHNDFIRVLHAYGAIGLALYLYVLIRFVRQGLVLRKHDQAFDSAIGNLMLLVVGAIALISITTEPLRYPSASWYLFALASLVHVRHQHAVRYGPTPRKVVQLE